MKKFIALIILILSLPGFGQKTITFTGPSFYYSTSPAAPGDTIVISAGDYTESAILKITGSATKPVIIKNNGPVRMGVGSSRYGLKLEGSFFKVLGDGQWVFTCTRAGDYLGTSIDFNNSSDYEVSGLVVEKTQLGLRSNPTTGTIMKNIIIRNNTFRLTGNPTELGRCEAVYFGNTEPCTIGAAYRFVNLIVKDNILTDLTGDGIQITNAEGLTLIGNKVTGFGSANLDGQMSAYIIGGCSNGTFTNNTATNGNGPGLQVFGHGVVNVTGNVFTDCGQSPGNTQDVIYINCKTPGASYLQVNLIDNTINGGKRYGINDATDVNLYRKGTISGNAINWIAKAAYSGPVPIPVNTIPVPADNRTVVFTIMIGGVTYIAYSDNKWELKK